MTEILKGVPVDRLARNVVSRGTHYDPGKGNVEWYADQPPVVEVPYSMRIAPSFVDLTGRVYGHMRVIGYGGTLGKQKGQRWVCQCICGRYEYRKASTIKRNVQGELRPNCCTVCNNTARTRDGLPSYLEASR